jgi:hypothetical protein
MACVRNRLVALAAIAALLALVAGGRTGGVAQDATPSDGAMAGGDGPHPAHIHAGACPDVGEVVFPLADVQASTASGADMASPDASPMASPMVGDSSAAIPAEVSVTTVEADLATILSAEHAINIHQSAEEIQVDIACGDIGGTPDDQGNLFIGLAEQNDSGESGTAWLHDNGDGTTTVTVFLAMGLHGGDGGMDMGTPAA